MNRKGVVSSVDNIARMARVVFKDLGNTVTYEIPYAKHIDSLQVNDLVAVSFFSENMQDGVIYAVY